MEDNGMDRRKEKKEAVLSVFYSYLTVTFFILRGLACFILLPINSLFAHRLDGELPDESDQFRYTLDEAQGVC